MATGSRNEKREALWTRLDRLATAIMDLRAEFIEAYEEARAQGEADAEEAHARDGEPLAKTLSGR